MRQKKKGQIFVCVLLPSLIQNVEKSIHSQCQIFSQWMAVKTHSTHSTLVFDTTHTSVATSAFVCSVGNGLSLLACFSSSPSVFSLSAGEKERARVCSRSCPFLVQLEQNFCVADHSKTDVSFIIIKKKKKPEKGNDRILPNTVSFVVLKKMYFSFWKKWKCVKLF